MLKLMIADDELTIRNGLSKLIKSYNLNLDLVGLASDGEKALELMKETKADIICVDINMPFINGLELIEHINVLNPYAKIIIISGYDSFEFAQKAISLNVFSYLLKPIDRHELKKVLEDAITEHKKQFLNTIDIDESLTCDISIKNTSVNYIKKNFDDPNLTLSSAAENLYISKSYLSKIIKEETSYSFTEFINKLRLENAKYYLKSTNLSIQEISEEVGFNSQHYFSRAFKKEFDLSPLHYRQDIKF